MNLIPGGLFGFLKMFIQPSGSKCIFEGEKVLKIVMMTC